MLSFFLFFLKVYRFAVCVCEMSDRYLCVLMPCLCVCGVIVCTLELCVRVFLCVFEYELRLYYSCCNSVSKVGVMSQIRCD